LVFVSSWIMRRVPGSVGLARAGVIQGTPPESESAAVHLRILWRGTWLFQFYHNAAVLNFDLRLWMTELNDFTFSGGLVIRLRFFEEVLVLPNDVFFTPFRDRLITRGR
jgi:hypothetical protein